MCFILGSIPPPMRMAYQQCSPRKTHRNRVPGLVRRRVPDVLTVLDGRWSHRIAGADHRSGLLEDTDAEERKNAQHLS